MDGGPKAGSPDAGEPDGGGLDAGAPDAGPSDAGASDGGIPDAGVIDAGVPDAGIYVTINIQGFAFSPAQVTVPAGAKVQVVNLDAVPHSVTSESAAGSFTSGSVNGVGFDTGTLSGHHSMTFTLSPSAPGGTVIPWFCNVHTNMMPEGRLTVQ